ncbi:MAG: methyl-accepting chemotaxis protein, partial [Stutzerimonas stutzeri]
MKISDLSISRKVGLLVLLMGIAAGTIAAVGGGGLRALGAAFQDTGGREEVAREAMDLRIDVIAISRMTYQLALAPEKAADFAAETEKRAKEMLDRLPKIASTADAEEAKLLDGVRASLAPYFEDIRAMVAVAGSPQGQDRAVMLAALDKALEGQKAVTVALKLYTT